MATAANCRIAMEAISPARLSGAAAGSRATDVAIRNMCRSQAMPGRIRVTFEREPDFSLGCRVAGEDCQILVARAEGDGTLAGVACRSARRLYVNGREERLGYLSQLRVAPEFQGRWLVARGFRLLKELHDADPVAGYLAVIVEGNDEAEGVLVRNRRKGFPTFYSVAEICTLATFVRGAGKTHACYASVTGASEFDLANVAAFLRDQGARRQFFPVWTEEKLRALSAFGLHAEDVRIARREGRIVGVAALWDQSGYKQTVVQSYSGWLKVAAPVYNSIAPWTRRSALPRPGEKLLCAYAALVCVCNDDKSIFHLLMQELHSLARSRNFRYVLLGMDASDPLCAVAREFKHVAYASRMYLVGWTEEGGGLHERLDGRPMYADIATL